MAGHEVVKSQTWWKWQLTHVELEELFLLSMCETGGNQPSCQHFQVLKRKTAFSLNRIRDKIFWDTVTTSLPVMTYRTKHITQAAQDTLGCECHLEWGEPRCFAKSMSVLSRRRPLILDNNKEFAAITGQGKESLTMNKN